MAVRPLPGKKPCRWGQPQSPSFLTTGGDSCWKFSCVRITIKQFLHRFHWLSPLLLFDCKIIGSQKRRNRLTQSISLFRLCSHFRDLHKNWGIKLLSATYNERVMRRVRFRKMIASKDKFHFWVGMTIVIVIAIFIGLLCTVFTPNYFRPKTVVETYFTESVNGLSPGAPVKFKGIDIGKVTDISLSSKVYPEHHIGLFSLTPLSLLCAWSCIWMKISSKTASLPHPKRITVSNGTGRRHGNYLSCGEFFKSHALSSRN